MQIIELLTPAYEAAWLPWAVQYFFLVGIAATSGLTVAALAILGRPGGAAFGLIPAATAVLAVSVIAAPVSLLADLHQPGRFWHFYAYPTPWSWMSLGAFLLPAFVLLSVLFCVLWWFKRVGALRAVAVLLALSAAGILVYTGMEVMVVRARPLWNTLFLPVNFALTAWFSAIGAMLLVSRWLPGGLQARQVDLLRRLGLASVALLSLGALAWAVCGLAGLDASFGAAIRLADLYPVWRVSLWGSIATGVFVTALLLRHSRFLLRSGYSLLVASAMLAAGWIFRWIIFMAVQGVPKYGAGLYLYQMPLGGDGLLGIVGVLGLCVALIAGVSFLCDRYPGRAMGQVSAH